MGRAGVHWAGVDGVRWGPADWGTVDWGAVDWGAVDWYSGLVQRVGVQWVGTFTLL